MNLESGMPRLSFVRTCPDQKVARGSASLLHLGLYGHGAKNESFISFDPGNISILHDSTL